MTKRSGRGIKQRKQITTKGGRKKKKHRVTSQDQGSRRKKKGNQKKEAEMIKQRFGKVFFFLSEG
jgi:hypothetical protein